MLVNCAPRTQAFNDMLGWSPFDVLTAAQRAFAFWTAQKQQEQVEDEKMRRMYSGEISTRFECSSTSSPLVSSVILHLLHSFRVYFHIFSTRFECIFRS